MKTKLILSAVCCFGVFAACNQDPRPAPPLQPPIAYMESYIATFLPVNELYMTGADSSNNGGLIIAFAPEYGKYVLDEAMRGNNDSNLILPQSDQYKTLVEKIGDTSFDRNVRQNTYFLTVSLLDTVKTVTITCDKDFDAAHPAGSNLNDLFTISFNDVYALIKNNYEPPAGTYQYDTSVLMANYPYAVIREKLSKVYFPDHPFMGIFWDCVLDSTPAKTDTYTFTVQIVLENGKTLTSSASLAIKGTE